MRLSLLWEIQESQIRKTILAAAMGTAMITSPALAQYGNCDRGYGYGQGYGQGQGQGQGIQQQIRQVEREIRIALLLILSDEAQRRHAATT